MLRIAMVEDEAEAKDIIQSYLRRFSEERQVPFTSEWFSSPIEFLKQDFGQFDLILLDIEMPEMNGMDLAKEIRKKNDLVALIFVTNMAQYAIKGYEVDALDYVVKPVSYYDFSLKIERVFRKLKCDGSDKLTLSCEGENVYVRYQDIVYIDVLKHNLSYHTKQKDIVVRSSLKKAEEVFLEKGFAKCNNYCLVNLSYVRSVKGFDLVLFDGEKEIQIQISHPRKKDFVHALNCYLGKNL